MFLKVRSTKPKRRAASWNQHHFILLRQNGTETMTMIHIRTMLMRKMMMEMMRLMNTPDKGDWMALLDCPGLLGLLPR